MRVSNTHEMFGTKRALIPLSITTTKRFDSMEKEEL